MNPTPPPPPSPPNPRLAARRGRIQLIRKRAVAWSVAVFLAAWGVIFLQLADGKDPALSTKAKSTNTSTSTSTPTSTGSSSSPTPASTPSPAPVTTSQS